MTMTHVGWNERVLFYELVSFAFLWIQENDGVYRIGGIHLQ